MRFRSRVVRGGAWLGLLLACGYEAAAAATGTILVTVLKEPAVPASGAQVLIVGTNTGAATNQSGIAALHVVPGTYQVSARFIGFCVRTATAVVTEGQTTNVTLVLGTAPCSGPVAQVAAAAASIAYQPGERSRCTPSSTSAPARRRIRFPAKTTGLLKEQQASPTS